MSRRRAGVDDLAAIMQVERASFQGDAWSDAIMRAELESEHNWYVIDEEAGRVLGYAGLRAPVGSSDADVQTIALDASARGRGRGRALLRALLAEAGNRGIREVFLDVREDNASAQALYVSEGFVEIGRRPNYYPDGNVDAIVMRLDLPGWQSARGSASASENRTDVGGSTANDPTLVPISDDAGACT
ncbi:ribosomal protein S18-alanine N-acetyltransferase [Microbacterium sp. P05]|uniref:ribosomal protein S18-alanine N-acetyltransferase n=1 Tax=Microbacterium sp. P05 TaxID=3366948 RepID=UPI003745798A